MPVPDFTNLDYETLEDSTIVRITLNRPEKMNALSQDLLFELNEALHDAEGDPEARVVILRGAGRAFSAGYDPTPARGGEQQWVYPAVDTEKRRLIGGMRTSMTQITDIQLYFWNMTKVTIAQVHGYAIGGAGDDGRPRDRDGRRPVRTPGHPRLGHTAQWLHLAADDSDAAREGADVHGRLDTGDPSGRTEHDQQGGAHRRVGVLHDGLGASDRGLPDGDPLRSTSTWGSIRRCARRPTTTRCTSSRASPTAGRTRWGGDDLGRRIEARPGLAGGHYRDYRSAK